MKIILRSKHFRRIFLISATFGCSFLSQCNETIGKAVDGESGSVDSSVTTDVSNKLAPPLGFWTDKESGLYVSVQKKDGEVEDFQSAFLNRVLQVGGPPNKPMNADDAFFPTGRSLKENTIKLMGTFNWDPDENSVTILVEWSESAVTLTILKDDGYERYEEKKYTLKLRK